MYDGGDFDKTAEQPVTVADVVVVAAFGVATGSSDSNSGGGAFTGGLLALAEAPFDAPPLARAMGGAFTGQDFEV